MKNSKILFIAVIILLIIGLAWFLISSDKKTDPEALISPEEAGQELSELDKMRQEALIRWQANCEADGGVWLSDYEMCYTEENALAMKESCEFFEGTWVEDSMIYECEIKDEVFKLGEWEMIEWEMYEEMKSSCLDYGGEWLGGAGEACVVDGDTFYQGRWLVLDEMEESCVNEFGGQWLGGEETECKIDGVVYPGNWVQIFAMKDSCKGIDGTWLGGEENQCKVNGEVYSYGSWERIEEMKESCEEVGGSYVGGDRFRCDIEGKVYFDGSWERIAKAPSMGERCIEDGGSWDAGRRTCEGLEKDWCDEILMELDLGSVGWNGDTLSCFIY
jgi:hypothetical protein